MESDMRAQGWVSWHLAARSAPAYSSVFIPALTPSTSPSITICVLYNPEKWGNNLVNVIGSIRDQQNFGQYKWEILVLVKSTAGMALQ